MHYEHKFKCLACGLHYVVCSDYEEWPQKEFGTASYCPECGSISPKLHWRETSSDPIFVTVPGTAEMVGIA